MQLVNICNNKDLYRNLQQYRLSYTLLKQSFKSNILPLFYQFNKRILYIIFSYLDLSDLINLQFYFTDNSITLFIQYKLNNTILYHLSKLTVIGFYTDIYNSLDLEDENIHIKNNLVIYIFKLWNIYYYIYLTNSELFRVLRLKCIDFKQYLTEFNTLELELYSNNRQNKKLLIQKYLLHLYSNINYSYYDIKLPIKKILYTHSLLFKTITIFKINYIQNL